MGIHAQTLVNSRIKLLRQSTRLTDKEFATLMGVSLQSVRNYEADKTDPSGAFFVKICQVFGPVAVAWVLGHGEKDDIKSVNVAHLARTFDREETVKILRAKNIARRL